MSKIQVKASKTPRVAIAASEYRFGDSSERMVGRNGELNASNKRDLLAQQQRFIAAAASRQVEGDDAATSRELIAAAFNDKEAHRILGERMADGLVASLEGYHGDYGLTASRLRRAAADAIVMHPGPMNRGVEITDDVADGPQSRVLRQVANGVAVRMAVLEALLG